MSRHLRAVVAIMRAVVHCMRRHKLLLSFPLFAVASLVLLLGAAIVAVKRLYAFLGGLGLLTLAIPFAFFLFALYAGYVSFTFWAVALTRATLVALRGEKPRLLDAVIFAAKRPGAVLGFALISSTFGLMFSAFERRTFLFVRALMATLGFAWTLSALLAMPAMVREKRGAFDALRRGAVLVRGQWAEGELSTLGLGLLWIPLLGLETLGIGAAAGGPLNAGLMAVLALNGLLIVATWLFERVYGAAVYVYATEGVAPTDFPAETLVAPWSVSESLAGGTVIDRVSAKRLPSKRWRVAALVAFVVASCVYAVYSISHSSEPQLPADALAVEMLPSPWKARWTVTLPERAEAMVARGRELLIAGQPHFLSVSVAGDVVIAEAHGLGRGETTLLLGEGGRIVGVDGEQARVWSPQLELEWFGLADARIYSFGLVGGRAWGVLTTTEDKDACFWDRKGVKRWCRRSTLFKPALGMDCNGDGVEDILVAAEEGMLPFDNRYVCLDENQAVLAERSFPLGAQQLALGDLDGDGAPELLVPDAPPNAGAEITIRTARGDVRRTLHLDVTPANERAPEGVVRVGGQAAMMLIVDGFVMTPRPHSLPRRLIGVPLHGSPWRLDLGGDTDAARKTKVARVDFDGDGVDEIVTLNERVLTSWEWRQE